MHNIIFYVIIIKLYVIYQLPNQLLIYIIYELKQLLVYPNLVSKKYNISLYITFMHPFTVYNLRVYWMFDIFSIFLYIQRSLCITKFSKIRLWMIAISKKNRGYEYVRWIIVYIIFRESLKQTSHGYYDVRGKVNTYGVNYTRIWRVHMDSHCTCAPFRKMSFAYI